MSVLTQMKLLVNMARIEVSVADSERNYIINIGRANGIYPDEVTSLFEQPHDILVPGNLSTYEKFQYILSLIQLMKIDERMYKEEIQFCSGIAERLGYNRQVMFDLLLNVKPGKMSDDEIARLKRNIEQHLKK